MLHKKLGCALLVALLFFVFPLSAQAATADEIIGQQKEMYGWDEIEQAVPEDAYENAKSFESKLSIENIEEFLSPGGILRYLGGAFLSAFTGNGTLLYGLLALLLVALFIKILSDGHTGSSVVKIMNTAVILSAAVMLFENIFASVENVTEAIGNMSSFSTAVLPISVSLTAAAGRPAFSAAFSTVLLFAVQFFTAVLSAFIVPCTNIYMAMGVGAGLSDNRELKNFSSFLKNGVIIVLTFLYSLFAGMMSLQSVFTATGDSLAKQAIKFAAGSFIPVAGSYLGEGVETVYTCAAGLRNTSGVFGIAVLFFLAAVPVLTILSRLVLLKIAQLVCGFFGNTVLSSFFGIAKDVFSILISVVLGYSIMLMLMLTILMHAG